jgi:hypothetical protein
MNKIEFAKALESDRLNKWRLDTTTDVIHAVRVHNGQAVTVEFTKESNGQWRLQFPKYTFHSKQSYFTPASPTPRDYLTCSLIVSLTNQLKRTGLWSQIQNQDFFVVNKHNVRADRKTVSGIRKSLLSSAKKKKVSAKKEILRKEIQKPTPVKLIKESHPMVKVTRAAKKR